MCTGSIARVEQTVVGSGQICLQDATDLQPTCIVSNTQHQQSAACALKANDITTPHTQHLNKLTPK